MANVEVRTAADGVPISLVLDGRTWRVAADPVRWFERISWWETAARMSRDQGSGIDVEVWQLQARMGRNPRSPLVTFVLARSQGTGEWTLRSKSAVTD